MRSKLPSDAAAQRLWVDAAVGAGDSNGASTTSQRQEEGHQSEVDLSRDRHRLEVVVGVLIVVVLIVVAALRLREDPARISADPQFSCRARSSSPTSTTAPRGTRSRTTCGGRGGPRERDARGRRSLQGLGSGDVRGSNLRFGGDRPAQRFELEGRTISLPDRDAGGGRRGHGLGGLPAPAGRGGGGAGAIGVIGGGRVRAEPRPGGLPAPAGRGAGGGAGVIGGSAAAAVAAAAGAGPGKGVGGSRVYVGNPSWSTWQDLKDHVRRRGAARRGADGGGRHRTLEGCGIVTFALRRRRTPSPLWTTTSSTAG